MRRVWRELKAKLWPDGQALLSRRSCWIKGPITLKSKTYTESTDVDVIDISVKETEHYPGRPLNLPKCYQHRDVLGRIKRSKQRS